MALLCIQTVVLACGTGDEDTVDVGVVTEVLKNFSVKDIQNGITAVICTSDYIALPIMTSLQEQNIAVPDDVSIIGFDNLEFS